MRTFLVILLVWFCASTALAQGKRGDKRREGGPKAGSKAVDMKLLVLGKEGECVRLSDAWNEKPVVLIFGSYT